MSLMFLVLLFTCFLVVLLKFAAVGLSESSLLSREELSPYECGFEHHSVSRVPFSVRYFFLTLIFLLFDLEVVLMLFVPYNLLFSYYYFSFLVVMVFVFILYLGLMYEWNDGTLEWVS